MSRELVIIAGVRTPFTRMGTELAGLSASDLGRHAVAALIDRTALDPASLSEVIYGCVGQPADSANIARIIALRAGVPQHVPAATVNRNCASGLEAITCAHQRLVAGIGDLFIVGGAESMSNYPLIYRHGAVEHFTELAKSKTLKERLLALTHFRPEDFSPLLALQLGLSDPVSGMNMGETAENLVRDYAISREAQDHFAARSHEKALAAQAETQLEIAAVHAEGIAVTKDNGIRSDSTVEKLSKLRPAFDQKTGSVTAGNASQITDGAVALLVGSNARAEALGIEPLGRLVDYAYTGCAPSHMGLGPVKSIAAANTRAELTLDDADLIEINEAFAAQVLSVLKALKHREFARKAGLDDAIGSVSESQINPRGGSIALGHPVGATGARLVLSALNQLKSKQAQRALVSLCIGGGQGAALWLERA
jgi:acetyl-CoA C-acetyltransferase/acetyl-CoA acyltransferase